MSDRLMEEVYAVLGHSSSKPVPTTIQERGDAHDPAVRARKLLDTHTKLSTLLQKRVDAVTAEMAKAKQGAKRLDRHGSGNIEAPTLLGGEPLSALKDLQAFVTNTIRQVEGILAEAGRGRGSMGYESRDKYLDMIDKRIEEIRSPKNDSAPDNASVNDYSAELVAAAQNAAGYLSTPTSLKIGSTVHIGRKNLAVVGAPRMGDAGVLVTLAAADTSDSYNQTSDAYELLIPFSGETSAPPSMTTPQMTVKPTAEAILTWGGRSTKILAADIRLEEGDYGDHMTNYGDYVSGMGKVNPGDKIKLTTPTEFRVIGKTDNVALVQPTSMDGEMYGKYRAAAQYARTPVGSTTNAPAQKDQWSSAMGRIPAGSDFPGRGGKAVQDTRPATGMRLLRFNPHNGKFSMPSGTNPGEYEMAQTIQIVGHEPGEPTAVGESMTIDRFEYTISEANGSNVMEKLARVAEADVPMKVNDILVDPVVAEALVGMHSRLSEGKAERMAGMGLAEMLRVSERMLGALTGGLEEDAVSTIQKYIKKLGVPLTVDKREVMGKQYYYLKKGGKDFARAQGVKGAKAEVERLHKLYFSEGDISEADLSKADWQHALKSDQAMLVKYEKDLKTLQRGGKVPNLTVDGAKDVIAGLKQVIANKKKLLAKMESDDYGDAIVLEFRNGRTAEKVALTLEGNDIDVEVVGNELRMAHSDLQELFDLVNESRAYFTEKTFSVKKKSKVKNPGKYFKPEMFKKADDKDGGDKGNMKESVDSHQVKPGAWMMHKDYDNVFYVLDKTKNGGAKGLMTQGRKIISSSLADTDLRQWKIVKSDAVDEKTMGKFKDHPKFK